MFFRNAGRYRIHTHIHAYTHAYTHTYIHMYACDTQTSDHEAFFVFLFRLFVFLFSSGKNVAMELDVPPPPPILFRCHEFEVIYTGTKEARWLEITCGLKQWQAAQAISPTGQYFWRHVAHHGNAPVSSQTLFHVTALPLYVFWTQWKREFAILYARLGTGSRRFREGATCMCAR